jgi:hypothetical protein
MSNMAMRQYTFISFFQKTNERMLPHMKILTK